MRTFFVPQHISETFHANCVVDKFDSIIPIIMRVLLDIICTCIHVHTYIQAEKASVRGGPPPLGL